MYRPLPLMFIASILATTAALADPPAHGSRYQQNPGGRYERGAGEGNHQQRQPLERGDRGERRGPVGNVYAQRAQAAPPVREPARAANRQVYVPDAGRRNDTDRRYGNEGRGNDSRGVVGRVVDGRSAGRDNDARYGRGDYRNDRPGWGNDRDQGHERYRNAGWTRDRDYWRDDRGRSWHHDRDWYQHYRNDHFRFYGNRYYARQRFTIGYYDAPWGYSARLWAFGDRLPLSYYGDRYIVDDYYNYDLYAPPYATAWVRVGDDVLLVDLDSGEVLDVIANLFW